MATTATRKTTPTRKRPAAAKKPDMVVKTSAGPIALNRGVKAGDMFDLADAEDDTSMETLRVIRRIFANACHDEVSFQRVRDLDVDELKDIVPRLLGDAVTEDGTPAGESSGS